KTRMKFERKKDSYFSVPSHVAIKLSRRDASHDMRDAVQRERLADDVRIGVQMRLPVAVFQNHARLSGRAEARSAKHRHADRLEVICGDKHYPHGVFLDLALPVRP